MENQEQTKLRFYGMDVFNIQFASKQSYDHKSEIKIHIEPKVAFMDEYPLLFKILMPINLTSQSFFDLSIDIIGHFELSNDVDSETKKKLINTNAPAILFPYVRSFITTLTSQMGDSTGPIIIPPRFFKGEIEEFKMEENS
jgi:preprotein translocase subunit SecB